MIQFLKKGISILCFAILIATSYGQGLRINEAMSDNESFDFDGLGNTPDWIELYNSSSEPINVAEFALRLDEGESFALPNVLLSQGAFMLIYLAQAPSGVDEQFYIDNPISRMGDRVALVDANDQVVDELWIPTLADDQSYGRVIDGIGAYGLLSAPSPGLANSPGGLGSSKPTGFYSESFYLELTTSSTDYEIRYTIDGSVPTAESILYDAPIELSPYADQDYSISAIPTDPPDQLWNTPDYVFRGSALRAATFLGGTRISPVLSRTFFINPEMESRYSFPIVSILADSVDLFSHETGIYVPGVTYENTSGTGNPQGNYDMRGSDWEREIHLSYIEPGGEVGFESAAGIRIRGGWSPRFPQKSLNVYFRSEYGLKDVEYPLFLNTELERHKRLILRNSGNDFFSSRFRDVLCHDIFKETGLEFQAYRPSLVFINGEYWGIKNMREKNDERYLERHFGGDEDDYMIVGVCGEQGHGETTEYDEMIQFVDANSLAESPNYNQIAQKLDIPNFIDYNVAELFFANQDWPCNNHRFWKSQNDTARWRMMIYDMDQTFGYSDSSFDTPSIEEATMVGDFPFCGCSNILLRKLLENDSFKEEFVERFYCQIQTIYSANSLLEKIDELTDLYRPEISEHAARWGYPWNLQMWEGEVEELRSFAQLRATYMEGHLQDYFEIESFDYECKVLAEVDETGLILFPNPSAGLLKIKNDTSADLIGELTVTNLYGQSVIVRPGYSLSAGAINGLSVSELAAGHYLLNFKTASQSFTSPLIIE